MLQSTGPHRIPTNDVVVLEIVKFTFKFCRLCHADCVSVRQRYGAVTEGDNAMP